MPVLADGIGCGTRGLRVSEGGFGVLEQLGYGCPCRATQTCRPGSE